MVEVATVMNGRAWPGYGSRRDPWTPGRDRFRSGELFGLGRGRFGLVAEQLEHLLDVRDETFAGFLRLGIGLEIKITIRQTEAALVHEGDYHRGVVQVGRRCKSKESGNALLMQIGDGADEVLPGLDGRNTVELGSIGLASSVLALRPYRRHTCHLSSVDGIAFGTASAVFSRIACRMSNCVPQLVETAPTGLVAGDGILHPSAAGVLVEVHASIDAKDPWHFCRSWESSALPVKPEPCRARARFVKKPRPQRRTRTEQKSLSRMALLEG